MSPCQIWKSSGEDMPTIRIPPPLRPYTGGSAEVPVAGPTVGAVLTDLTSRHPNLKQPLYTDAGELRAFVNVFLNDEDIRHLKGAETPVQDTERLMIIPRIAGGMAETLENVDHSAL